MSIFECSQCGSKKYVSIYLKDYVYMLKDKAGKKHYFCDYACMRKAKRESPEKWVKKRII